MSALRDRWTHLLLRRGGLLALSTLGLYIWLAPAHIVDGDNSEFSTLSVTGGVAHPSGYPLFVLWLRAMSWLPGTTPAHTAALATAVLAAGSILVLHAACRAWGARPLAATIAVTVFAAGPIVLRTYTEAEVFALNGLVAAAILWLMAHDGPVRGASRALILGLVAGLGLANHMTCALLAPIGLYGVVRGIAETHRSRIAVGVATLVAVVVGLVPYAYLLVAPDAPMSWGSVHDLRELVGIVMRDDYGGPGAFRSGGPVVSAWTSIGSLVADLARGWLWIPLAIGMTTLVLRAARPGRPGAGEPRAGWILLAITFVLAGPLLVARFNVPPTHLGLYVCRRFYLLPMLLAAIPCAVGLGEIGERIAQRIEERQRSRLATLALVVVATAGLAGVAALSLPALASVHGPAVENSAHNLLRSLPRDAVVIASQDELHAATGYVQTALGVRQDVTVVTWTMMTLAWYRARMASRGIVAGPGAGSPIVRLVSTLLAKGRPVFVDRLQTEIIARFPTYPYGIVIRVLPPGTKIPSVAEVFAQNQQLYASFELDEPRPGPDDEYATEVHRRYAAIWQMIGTALKREGRSEDAAWAFETAHQLEPRR